MTRPIVFVGLAMLCGVVLGATVFRDDLARAAGIEAPKLVTVVNDSSSPVPVTERNVDGGGNVRVHEQGTANVNVTNSPLAVSVQNVPAPAQPVTIRLICSFGGFRSCGTSTRVPSDKRLVIETMSAGAATDTGVAMHSFRLEASVNGVTGEFWLFGTHAFSEGGTDESNADTREVRIYADPGTALVSDVVADGATGGGAEIDLSGYYVPA